jgi:hypothetical protein
MLLCVVCGVLTKRMLAYPRENVECHIVLYQNFGMPIVLKGVARYVGMSGGCHGLTPESPTQKESTIVGCSTDLRTYTLHLPTYNKLKYSICNML